MATTRLPATILLIAFTVCLRDAVAQCPLTWSGAPQPELTGNTRCIGQWDPDGSGPLPSRMVVSGRDLLGGAQLITSALPSQQQVMTWDGSRWEALGPGPGSAGQGSRVYAITVWNGDLIAGGDFNNGGLRSVARWDGTAWQPLANGLGFTVLLLVDWNGSLFAIGGDTSTGAKITRWNGVTWTPLPTPPTLREPRCAVVFEGELCIGGIRPSAQSGVIERWNGSSWASSITAQGSVESLAVRVPLGVGASQTLFACGWFTAIGGTPAAHVAKTDGGATFAWSSVGSGLSVGPADLHVRNSGLNDYVLVAGSSGTLPVMRYTSSTGAWTAMGATVVPELEYWAGGYHGTGIGEGKCNRWDGSSWVPVRGPGIAGDVHAVTRSGDDVVLGGSFETISGVAVNRIARWDGDTFTPLGSGITGTSVDALVTLDNGDIVAGGSFTAAGGAAANHIARWNGTTWSPMGAGMDLPVRALCRMPNGDVIAGGEFSFAGGTSCSRIARWNGTAWEPMHFGMNDAVLALVVRNDGTLFAGGKFTIASTFSRYRVAQWTGSVWGQVGAAMNDTVHGLAARPNGDIIAVGEFTQASLQAVDRIARWNGSTWVSMGANSGDQGLVRAVHALPNGDVVAGRGFHQAGFAVDTGISRWDGTTWDGLSVLTGTTTTDPVTVRAFAQRADGDLVVGGSFHVAGLTMAHALAALESDCMPLATPYGAGCSTSAGPLVLTADALPFLGAPFKTTTTGIAAGSMPITVIGLTQVSIPLDALLPEGRPGCTLLTTLDATLLASPGPGNTALSQFAFGSSSSLLGVTFYQQTMPVELDGSGGLLTVRASNAIVATIGTL